jgi:hypothetical protein
MARDEAQKSGKFHSLFGFDPVDLFGPGEADYLTFPRDRPEGGPQVDIDEHILNYLGIPMAKPRTSDPPGTKASPRPYKPLRRRSPFEFQQEDIEDIFRENQPERFDPMETVPRGDRTPIALADASGSMPTRIDLGGMPGPRGGGERTRIDLGNVQDLAVGNAVNRDAKRDREDVVEVPGMALGMGREALGQAMLMGQGDDVEAWFTGRNPDDIRRERNAFADENRLAANGAFAGGMLTGGFAPRVIKALAGAAKPQQLDDMPPRTEPDLRQAMRSADEIDMASRPADAQRDAIERLLSNPEARAEVRGQPLELSPADMFMMTAGGPESGTPGAPEISAEEQALRAMSPTDALQFGQQLQAATPVSDEQRAQNLRTTGRDLLSVTPGPGNVMAAQDAVEGSGRAWDAIGAGDARGGLMEAALAALAGVGAVTGLPTSRAAGQAAKAGRDTANVFLPLPPGSRKADAVLADRQEGRALRDIYREHGLTVGPDGTVRREIPDAAMKVDQAKLQPGAEMELGELVQHPKLFEHLPEYARKPVRILDSRQHNDHQLARTQRDELGGQRLEITENGDLRPGLAKMMQYEIARDRQLPAPLYHGTNAIPEGVDKAVQAFREAPVSGRGDLDALAAYVDKLMGVKEDYTGLLGIADPKKHNQITKTQYAKSAGNVDSRVVTGRATMSDDELARLWPYSPGAPYSQKKPGKRVPDWEDMFVLPPEKATGEDLMEFLRSWRQYGAGRAPGGRKGWSD